jgi:carboxymethylenebutenolidase
VGENISFRANGHTTPAYVAHPTQPGPGIVVIQEWWGLVPHIERIADRFAQAGFVALAPDLYHGEKATTPDQEDVTHLKVGTVGFCMGGALSLFAACRNPEVGACAVFYGGHPNISPDLESLQAPVLGIYAGKDTFVTPDVVKELDRQLTTLGRRHEFHTYPNAQHAFFNDERPEVYDGIAAADAWTKTLAFFRRELRA